MEAAMNEINDAEDTGFETGGYEDVCMFLGKRDKIRPTGTIHGGAKVPKNSCTEAEKAKFKQLEAKGMDYDEIDKAIGGVPKSAKSKLYPTNIDYFVIRDSDFKRPQDAQFIREHFADADGKVRRIPIWLTTGDIDTAIPLSHRAFDGGNNLRAYSFYEGTTLMLKYVPTSVGPVPKKEDWITTEFDPDKPPADGPNRIKFGGMFKFNVQEIPGAGEIVVPTQSWNGLGDAVAVLRRIEAVFGRFHGLYKDKPFLELVKVNQIVKTPEGKKPQQLVTIECSVDMAELAIHAEKKVVRGATAMNVLNGGRSGNAPPEISATAGKAADIPVTAEKQAPADKTAGSAPAEKQAPVGGEASQSAKAPAAGSEAGNKAEENQSGDAPPSIVAECQKEVDALYKMAAKAGLTDLELEAYGNFKMKNPIYAELDPARLKKLRLELEERLKADPKAVKARCQEILKETSANGKSGASGTNPLETPEVEGINYPPSQTAGMRKGVIR
jgi:hypothetical protein